MQNACPKCGKAWDDHTWDGKTRIDVTCPSCQVQINTTGLLQLQAAGARSEEPAPELPASVRTASLDPGNRFGKHVRTKLLGEGGMGQVWMAWDTEISRWVALKIPKFDDATELARLKAEAQAAGKLSHPNVAAVYEFGQTQGRHFIAMEYVDGVTLADYPRGDRKKLVAFVRQAALGIAYAHLHGVVHRDIKPVNIMVQREREQVYVMDFGIARQAASTKVSTSVVGTPAYMSPEQAQGEQADARSDVWALGVTLYELMADRMPFEDPSPMGTLRKVVEEEPRPLAHVDADLNTIVLKCLEKNPGRRYAGATELAEELSRWASGEAILAHPPSLSYRLRKTLAKRRAIVLVVLAALLLLGGVAAAAWLPPVLREREWRDNLARLSDLRLEAARILERKKNASQDPAGIRSSLKSILEELTLRSARHPDRPQSHFVLGEVRYAMGNLQGAQTALEEATKRDAEAGPAWIVLARTYLEGLRQVSGSENMESQLRLAQVALQRGAPKGLLEVQVRTEPWGLARTSLDAELEVLVSSLGLYYLAKDPETARRQLRKAHEKSPSGECCFWLALWSPTLQEHLEWLDRSIALAPLDAKPYLDRAFLRGSSGPLVIQDLDRVIALDPGNAMAFFNRGIARENQNEFALAEEDFSRAIGANSDHAAAYAHRAAMKRRRGEFAGAVSDLTEALRINPLVADRYLDRAQVQAQLRQGAAAAADLDKALDLAPGNWPFRAEAQSLKARMLEGRFEAFFDVTSLVAARLQNNRLNLVADNATFGDPVPGVAKKLRVEYLDGEEARSRTVQENETLDLQPGEGRKLIIKKALYGHLP